MSIQKDEKFYVAHCLDLGVTYQGGTLEEAQAHREALELAADIRMSRGDPADPEDCIEVNEETKRDIEKALAEFKAGKFHTAEEVYKELGLTGKKKVK